MTKSAWYALSIVVLSTLSLGSQAQTAPASQVMSGSNPRPQVMSGSNPRPQVMSGSNPRPQVMSGSNPRPQVNANPVSTAVSTVLSLFGVYTF